MDGAVGPQGPIGPAGPQGPPGTTNWTDGVGVVSTTAKVQTSTALIDDKALFANSAVFSHKNQGGSSNTFGFAHGANGSAFINIVDAPGQHLYLTAGGLSGSAIALMDKTFCDLYPPVRILDLSAATSDTVGVMPDGTLFRLGSSSRRFKKNIQAFESDALDRLLEMEPVTFEYIDRAYGPTDEPMLGYIAEQVEELGLTGLISYSADGQVRGIKYDRIPIYTLEIVKRQQQEIDELRAQLEATRKESEDRYASLAREMEQIMASLHAR